MNDTDWERLANMSDAEAYQNALDDPDNPPLTEDEMRRAARIRDVPGATLAEKRENLKKKRYKKLESIKFDWDVLDYFHAKGIGYHELINDILRAYMEAEQKQ